MNNIKKISVSLLYFLSLIVSAILGAYANEYFDNQKNEENRIKKTLNSIQIIDTELKKVKYTLDSLKDGFRQIDLKNLDLPKYTESRILIGASNINIDQWKQIKFDIGYYLPKINDDVYREIDSIYNRIQKLQIEISFLYHLLSKYNELYNELEMLKVMEEFISYLKIEGKQPKKLILIANRINNHKKKELEAFKTSIISKMNEILHKIPDIFEEIDRAIDANNGILEKEQRRLNKQE